MDEQLKAILIAIALILSILSLIASIYVIYEENANTASTNRNTEDISSLTTLTNQVAQSVAVTNTKVVNINPTELTNRVDVAQSNINAIYYCAKKYNDQDEYEDFADCIRARL